MAEEKEEFKIRLDWEKLSREELSHYIFDLHTYLCSFEVSSIKQLLISLDGVAQKMCDDLDRIADGEIENLKILNPDKGDAVFERVMKIIEKVDSFKKISTLAESLRPDTIKMDGSQKTGPSKSQSNIFEQTMEKVKRSGR